MSKQTRRRFRKKHIFVYIIVFFAAGALVLTSVLGYLGARSLTANPRDNSDPIAAEIADREYRIEQFQGSLERDPDNPYFLTQLGNNYYQLGVVYSYAMDNDKSTESFESAIEPYGKVLEIEPDNVDVRVDRAVSAFWSGEHNYDLAKEEFETAISINPEHTKAHYNYGIFLFYGLGDPAQAIALFEKVVELAPADDPDLVENAEFMIAQANQAIEMLNNPPEFDTTPQPGD